MSSHTTSGPLAAAAGTITIGDDLTVNRMGFGAMRLTGKGIWGPPSDPREAVRVLRRAIELGVDFIDTADSYGPAVSEEIMAAALIIVLPVVVVFVFLQRRFIEGMAGGSVKG